MLLEHSFFGVVSIAQLKEVMDRSVGGVVEVDSSIPTVGYKIFSAFTGIFDLLSLSLSLSIYILKVFSCLSSGCHFFQRSNFGRGLFKEHFCEIILKLILWPTRRCRLKVYYFFRSGDHFLFSGVKRFKQCW